MSTSCRLCGGGLQSAFVAREMMQGTRTPFVYADCVECGCLQITEVPTDLSQYYGEDYYTAQQTFAPPSSAGPSPLAARWSEFRAARGGFRRALSGRRFARFDWFRYTRTRPSDAVLDVGCGSGRLLFRLARAGFSNLSGIDAHWPGEALSLPGLRIERREATKIEGRYALVMSHHSFEHLSEPADAFRAMAEAVVPGGHLLLRVPLADGWSRRHYGRDWAQLDAPRHLQIPTRKTVAMLAKEVGLRVVRTVDDSGPFQIWGSELARRDAPLMSAGRGGRRVLPIHVRAKARWQARRLRAAGLGDQACFYLRKD